MILVFFYDSLHFSLIVLMKRLLIIDNLFSFINFIVLSLKETTRRALYLFMDDNDELVDELDIPTSLKNYLKDLT